MVLNETAYAKINLALHVRERREDGYHTLETLFAFVDSGDTLSARTAEQDNVETIGEFATGIDNPFDNLVAKSLAALPRPQGLAITLEKNLPVAAGLGGGSADAGAVFRLVERLHGLPDDWQERAAKLGADAIIVSNHGGRQLDGALSSIRMLPEIMDAVGSQVEVHLDSGIRSGQDVLKALALGAKGTYIGRAFVNGLGAMGEKGVTKALEVIHKELDTTMALCGRRDVNDLDRDILLVPSDFECNWTGN